MNEDISDRYLIHDDDLPIPFTDESEDDMQPWSNYSMIANDPAYAGLAFSNL